MKDKKIVQEFILENKDKPSTCKQNSSKEIEQDVPLTQENHLNLVKSKTNIYEQVEVTDFDVNKQYDEIVKPSCTKIESPKNANNKNTSDEYKASFSPLQKKRKRKPYSPKDTDEIINDKHVTETLDERDEYIPLSKYKIKTKFNTDRDIPTIGSVAVCYKELEKVRKNHIRQSKRSKSKIKSSPLLSPRTLRNDQLFDKLKEGINYNGVKLVDTNSSECNLAIYNLTSESEDEDFKKKKITDYSFRNDQLFDKLKEGINYNGVKLVDTNSSECNLAIYNFTSESEDEDFKKKKITVSACVHSIPTKKGRVGRRKIKPESETNSSTEEGTNLVIKKRKKLVKRQNTKAKEVNTNNITMKDLEDEKIRVAGHEDLSSSFITVINQSDAQGEVEPILNNLSDLEIIPDIDYEKEEIQNSEIKPREKKNNEKLSLKNEKLANAKLLQKLQIIEEKNERESPLPDLLIETASKDTEDDQDSLVSSEMEEIFKKFILENLNDTWLNLTIDAENINSSLEQPDNPLEIDIYEKQEISNDNYQRSALVKPEKLVKKIKGTYDLTNINVNEKGNLRNDDALHFSELGITEEPIMIKEDKKYQKDMLPKRKQEQDKIEIEDDLNEKVSEKSIATADVEADSLSRQTFSQHIFQDLELQDLYFYNREYFLQLRPPIGKNSSQNDASKETSCDFEIQEGDKNNYSQKENSPFRHTPVVSITRLSNDAFKKWLLSSRSSISEANSQKIKLADIGENSSKTYNSKEATCSVETQAKVSNSKFTMAPVVSITREINPVESVSHESISQEENSSIENKEVNSRKRRPYTRRTSSKRRKVEINSKIEMLSASGPSVDSMHEWFMKELSESLSAIESHCDCKDTMQGILGKLDTRLAEMNRSTSKKFIQLFVEMRHHFDTIEERTRQLSADASNQINRLFAELNERSADMKEELICELKRRVAGLMREENQQKRDMVVMLREDVETEMANLEGRRKL